MTELGRDDIRRIRSLAHIEAARAIDGVRYDELPLDELLDDRQIELYVRLLGEYAQRHRNASRLFATRSLPSD